MCKQHVGCTNRWHLSDSLWVMLSDAVISTAWVWISRMFIQQCSAKIAVGLGFMVLSEYTCPTEYDRVIAEKLEVNGTCRKEIRWCRPVTKQLPSGGMVMGPVNTREYKDSTDRWPSGQRIMEQPYGEYVVPTDAIRDILRGYPFSIGLMREILQNSDDAKAQRQVRIFTWL